MLAENSEFRFESKVFYPDIKSCCSAISNFFCSSKFLLFRIQSLFASNKGIQSTTAIHKQFSVFFLISDT